MCKLNETTSVFPIAVNESAMSNVPAAQGH